LRIEPLASDVRDRTELAHALPFSAAGYVPPVPASWVFGLAALLWCAAWGNTSLRTVRRRSAGNRGVVALAVLATAISIGGFALNDRFAGRHLAVVRHTESLSHDPELGGERGATAIIGEVVRVTGRQGAWSRVVLDDGRDGWVESAALISLDARDASQIASE
jgi:hypothetical protein